VDALNQLSSIIRNGNVTVAGFDDPCAVNERKRERSNPRTAGMRTGRMRARTTPGGRHKHVHGRGQVEPRAKNVTNTNQHLPSIKHNTCMMGNGNLVSDGLRGFEYDDEKPSLPA